MVLYYVAAENLLFPAWQIIQNVVYLLACKKEKIELINPNFSMWHRENWDFFSVENQLFGANPLSYTPE